MSDIMTSILTDADMRSDRAVKDALIGKAEVAGPWFNLTGPEN